MSKRLDNRPNLYGGPRLSNAQVRTLEILAEYTTPDGELTANPEFVKSMGGNPGSLHPLSNMHLVREEEPSWWRITDRGLELLKEIREYMGE